MPAVLDRLRRLLPGLWAGVLLCIAAIAAPAAFALLERPVAGHVVGWFFQREAWTSVVLAALLLMIERPRARAAAAAGQGSVLSTEILLLLGTVFCTLAGYFALQPMMAAARAGQGALSFGQLHFISVGFFGAKLLCILALAWRAAGLSQPPSS
jgi:hypothetical protein